MSNTILNLSDSLPFIEPPGLQAEWIRQHNSPVNQLVTVNCKTLPLCMLYVRVDSYSLFPCTEWRVWFGLMDEEWFVEGGMPLLTGGSIIGHVWFGLMDEEWFVEGGMPLLTGGSIIGRVWFGLMDKEWFVEGGMPLLTGGSIIGHVWFGLMDEEWFVEGGMPLLTGGSIIGRVWFGLMDKEWFVEGGMPLLTGGSIMGHVWFGLMHGRDLKNVDILFNFVCFAFGTTAGVVLVARGRFLAADAPIFTTGTMWFGS